MLALNLLLLPAPDSMMLIFQLTLPAAELDILNLRLITLNVLHLPFHKFALGAKLRQTETKTQRLQNPIDPFMLPYPSILLHFSFKDRYPTFTQ